MTLRQGFPLGKALCQEKAPGIRRKVISEELMTLPPEISVSVKFSDRLENGSFVFVFFQAEKHERAENFNRIGDPGNINTPGFLYFIQPFLLKIAGAVIFIHADL